MTRLWAGRRRVRIPAGTKKLSPLQNVQTNSGDHPASYSMGAEVSFFGGKNAEREAEQSPPSCLKAKKEFH